MVYVADTHSVIWFLTEEYSKLGENAKRAFENTENGQDIIVISTISLMEILYVCNKKGIIKQFEIILQKMKKSLNYIVFDLNLEIVKQCVELEKVSEMHDRIIVATAKKLNAPVITIDKNIKDSEYAKVVW